MRDQLQARHEGLQVELVAVETSVRYSPKDPERGILGLEKALRAGKVDLVCHPLKEIPVLLPEDLRLVAVPERGNPFDAFVSRNSQLLDELPPGSRVGVSHPRQKVQLKLYRYDLEPMEIHGSVDSRLQQIESHELAGVIISAESLELLGLQERVSEILAPEAMLPAAGQGCIGFLARRDDEASARLARALEDHTTRLEAAAERAFLHRLGANPEIPLGVRASADSVSMIIEGFLGTPDGGASIRDALQGPPVKAEILGAKLGELLLALGPEELYLLVAGQS
jgi:hydroxymethylbilane synthase